MNNWCNCTWLVLLLWKCTQKDKIIVCSSIERNVFSCFYLCWALISSTWLNHSDMKQVDWLVRKCHESFNRELNRKIINYKMCWRQDGSPLWIRRCSFRWCLYLKAFPHSLHLNLRFPAPSFSSGGCRQKNKQRVIMWWRTSGSRWAEREADYETVEQELMGEFNSI